MKFINDDEEDSCYFAASTEKQFIQLTFFNNIYEKHTEKLYFLSLNDAKKMVKHLQSSIKFLEEDIERKKLIL
jgi:hypothetical protein